MQLRKATMSKLGGSPLSGPVRAVFTPKERRLLRDWFLGVDDPGFDRAHADWRLGEPPPFFSPAAVVVASILLSRLPIRNPVIGRLVRPEPTPAGVVFPAASRAIVPGRTMVPLTRHLFSLDWGTGQGPMAWATDFAVTPVPDSDKLVVTASGDDESVPFAAEVALGWFRSDLALADGVGATLVQEWARWRAQAGQDPWVAVPSSPLIAPEILEHARDTVWMSSRAVRLCRLSH